MTTSNLRFTVIIPTLNEAAWIESTIHRVRSLNPAVEIIVSDGSSSDATVELSRLTGAQVITSKTGRGLQCNAGAMQASGEVLLFLHADTSLPADAFHLLKSYFTDPGVQLGTFRLAFDEDNRMLRFYSAFTRFDSIFTRFGDQCIVIRKSFFVKLGGFPDWPLFEDVHLLRNARRHTRIFSFPSAVVTSARRFARLGVIRAQLWNALFMLLYFLGISPNVLATWYTSRCQERTGGPQLKNELTQT